MGSYSILGRDILQQQQGAEEGGLAGRSTSGFISDMRPRSVRQTWHLGDKGNLLCNIKLGLPFSDTLQAFLLFFTNLFADNELLARRLALPTYTPLEDHATEKKVSRQYRELVTEGRGRRRVSPPKRRLVYDIVVKQGCDMDHLHNLRQTHLRWKDCRCRRQRRYLP